jgi:hypothetical protein
MKMVFGLDFTNDSGEGMQFAVNTETEEVKIRVRQNGAWRTWQRIDVKRKPGGELDETVWEAKHAEIADHFTSPVTLRFSGAVTGSAQFDGKTKDVPVNLGVGPETRSVIASAVAEALTAHLLSHIPLPPPSYDGGGG